jgi:hypothetical protein
MDIFCKTAPSALPYFSSLDVSPLLFVPSSSPEVGVEVGWAPVSSGCLGAYNLRWVYKVKEKG